MIRLKTLIAAALLGLAACSPPAAKAPTQTLAFDAPLPTDVPKGVKLVIGDPTTQRVLEHTGWAKELPFQVEWAQITGGPAVTEAFHAKALDIGASADIPPIHATWVGIPVKIIAVRLRQDPLNHPSFVFGVAPKAGISTLADLRGKKIAFSPGQVQGEIVLRTLKEQHLTATDVQLIELPSTGDVYINALISGAIDIAPIGAGPASRRYLANYAKQGAKLIKHGAFRDDLTVLYVRQETLQDPAKAAALRAYVVLWARAADWVEAHRDEWAQLYYVQNQGLSPADARYALDAAGVRDVPRSWDDAVRIEQEAIEILAPQTGRKPFDAATLFDRRFESVAAGADATQ